MEHEPKNRFPRFFKFWFFTYIHLFINNQKIHKFSYILCKLSVAAKILDLQSVLWDNMYIIFKFRNMDVCVICFDKKRHFFKFILNPSRWGGSTLKVYYEHILSQHYIIMNQMIFLVFINYIFSFRGQAKNLFCAWMPSTPWVIQI